MTGQLIAQLLTVPDMTEYDLLQKESVAGWLSLSRHPVGIEQAIKTAKQTHTAAPEYAALCRSRYLRHPGRHDVNLKMTMYTAVYTMCTCTCTCMEVKNCYNGTKRTINLVVNNLNRVEKDFLNAFLLASERLYGRKVFIYVVIYSYGIR